MENGVDERNFGRGRRRGFAASRTRLTPNIPRQDSTVELKLYVGDVGAQAKPSTTGAIPKAFKHGAFTLAEVLITLSIIGVVAALTIPSLIVKNQEKETVVRLQKAFNIFANAFNLAQIEYGEASSWGWDTQDSLQGAKNGMDKLSPFLNITRRCDGTTGCYPKDQMYKDYMGRNLYIYDNSVASSKGILADGMIFFIWSAGEKEQEGDPRASIAIDINGFKPPNVVGKDTFAFYILSNKIIPAGANEDPKGCAQSNINAGEACTAWVLTQGNMNYPSADPAP